MEEEKNELIELKHLNVRCPVCGNTDFVRVKKSENGWLRWDIESDMEIFGCTKCSYLMHFSKSAVFAAMDNEDDRNKIQKEIDGCKKELQSLEEEEKELSLSLEQLENEASQYKEVPSYLREEIEKVKNNLEINVRWRIKLFKGEIERLESGIESNEYWPKYNHHDLADSYFFKEYWKFFDEMREVKNKINEICDELNKVINNGK